jgi:hypothetical protein
MSEIEGFTIPHYDSDGKIVVNISEENVDELKRPFVRAESRDEHDTTYFTVRGDEFISVSGENVGTGDGVLSAFYLDNKEVSNVVMYLDSTPTTAFTVDYSTFIDNNAASHFSRGLVTFNAPPSEGVEITADYTYAVIGTSPEDNLTFTFSATGQEKIVYVHFCDPAHIKDGVTFFRNGEIDSILNAYVVCPAGGYYLDNNSVPQYAFTETVLQHYVIDQILMGDAEMGVYFDVEARSRAMPVGYKLKFVISNGSAANLQGVVRLEINRERTSII